MNAKSFNISVRGASHIKRNKECQDASESYDCDEYSIVVVCDGHGGDDYIRSAIGSQIAANIAKENIKKFVQMVSSDEMEENSKKLLKNLEASIINNWNEEITRHFEKNPFTEKEYDTISEKAKKKYLIKRNIESAYGTTLIAVAVTKKYWFGIHIGDGKCVAVNSEYKFLQPIPWDEKCFLNETTSLCDNYAINNFREFFSKKLPIAVFIGSDGVDDCFNSKEQLNNLYKTILYSFSTTKFEEAVETLKEYMPRLSAKGSGDDISIASIINFDYLKEKYLELPKNKNQSQEKENFKVNSKDIKIFTKRVILNKISYGSGRKFIKRKLFVGKRILINTIKK